MNARHMKTMKTLIATLALGWGTAYAGAYAAPSDLPDSAAALKVLDDLSAVRAARAELRAAGAEARQLRAGEHEYSLGLSVQRRNVSGGPNSNDWGASVERGVRLPGKARLDDMIGARLVEEAEERVGDARHEAARQLLSLWYGALLAQGEADLWQQQAVTLAEEQRIVAVRVKRGDAARLDQLQADAALALARSQARQAEARAQAAQAELRLRFPGLPIPGRSTADPALPAGSEADWIERTLEHNHELLAVQTASERARLLTQRAEQDRTPDPALGLHLGSEANGDERIFGVSLRMPLAGKARAAKADMHLAQAEALGETEAATPQRLSAEAATNWQAAAGNSEGFLRLREAAEAMSRHAELARRAHELGELGLSDTLLAHRNALEARMNAEQARLAANGAIARLLLDAHQLWPMAEETHH